MCPHASQRDILRLWRLASGRYQAPKEQLANTTQNHSLWNDMPTQPGEVRQCLFVCLFVCLFYNKKSAVLKIQRCCCR